MYLKSAFSHGNLPKNPVELPRYNPSSIINSVGYIEVVHFWGTEHYKVHNEVITDMFLYPSLDFVDVGKYKVATLTGNHTQ